MTNIFEQSFDLPTFKRPELVAVEKDLKMISDLLGGTRVMHEASAEYIRKWKDEDPSVYDLRRKIETVYDGLGRTISASTGMLYAKSPAMEWNQGEAIMKPQWENCDASGTHGWVFMKRFSEIAIRDGLAVILVDHAPAPDGVLVTAQNEELLGLRPTWAYYTRRQVLSWRVEKLNNRTVVTQMVLEEHAEENKGIFGVIPVRRFRVLRLINGQAMWSLWRAKKTDAFQVSDFIIEGSGFFRNRSGQVKDNLPIAIAYTGRTDNPMTSTIPLLGVAWANLAHWQQASNLRFYRDLAAFPQPVIEGGMAQEQTPAGPVPGRLRVGPMVVVHLAEGGKFEWREIAGTSMDQLIKGIDEKERQMAQLGMSFLAKQTRQQETAEAKRLDATAENSTLATAGQGIQDAGCMALEHHAWYLGLEKKASPTMEINKDFDNTVMDPSSMVAYVTAVKDAGLPVRLLLQAWQMGGRIAPDVDLDKLELEMMANQAQAQANADAIKEADPSRKPKPPAAVDVLDDTGKRTAQLRPAAA